MCDMELTKGDTERQFGIDFDTYFADALAQLAPFEDDGLLVHEKGKILITKAGRLVIRNIAMAFDKYLKKDSSEKPLFSRTV
jgi:oxygen-independent coproporphyrinogen-3 oxidase